MSLLAFFERKLGQYARETIKREHPFIIAVTGSIGKSTTKQAIAAMLNADDEKVRIRVTKKNYNNELGLPLTIFDRLAPGRDPLAWMELLWTAWSTSVGLRKTGVKIFVLEMGADKPGDIAKLTAIAPPDVAVVTAVTADDTELAPVHVANYPSVQALVDEKLSLVRALRSSGVAVLNADDKRVFAMRHATQNHVMTFGESEAADVRIMGTQILTEEGEFGVVPIGIEFSLLCFNRQQQIRIPGVFGKSIVYAVCAALAVAEVIDLNADAVTRLGELFAPLPGRTRIVPGIKHTTLLDDTYNSSPAAVISALRDLGSIPVAAGQRKVACLGEMRELGEAAERMHQIIGIEVAKQGVDLLVICGKLAHAVAKGAQAGGMSEDQIKVVEDTPEAGLFLQDWIKAGDLILAKASEGGRDAKGNLPTGVRMERVIRELMAEPLHASELLARQDPSWQRK